MKNIKKNPYILQIIQLWFWDKLWKKWRLFFFKIKPLLLSCAPTFSSLWWINRHFNPHWTIKNRMTNRPNLLMILLLFRNEKKKRRIKRKYTWRYCVTNPSWFVSGISFKTSLITKSRKSLSISCLKRSRPIGKKKKKRKWRLELILKIIFFFFFFLIFIFFFFFFPFSSLLINSYNGLSSSSSLFNPFKSLS